MTRRLLNRMFVSLLGLASLLHVGCSDFRHRLLPHARDFRNVAPAPEAPRELAKTLHPAHVVEPGDVLLIQPTDLESPVRLCSDQPVLPDGTIDLGMYGRPVVAGKPVPVVEAEVNGLIRAKVVGGETVHVNVRLINRNSKVYYVLGEVVSPGAFPVKGNETALDAIIAAGGLNCQASENTIILSRPTGPCEPRDVKPICYRQIVQLGDTTTNYQIMPGDRIYVPSKTFKEKFCPEGCRPHCDPCTMPHMLKPMERPGCGVEFCPTPVQVKCDKPAKCDKPSLPACKVDECKRSGPCCMGWGITGCFLSRGKSCVPAQCEVETGRVSEGVIIIEPESREAVPAKASTPDASPSPTPPPAPKPAAVPTPPSATPPSPTAPTPTPLSKMPKDLPTLTSSTSPTPLPAVDPSKPLPTIPVVMPVAPKRPEKPE